MKMTRSHALPEMHVLMSCPEKTIGTANRVSWCRTQQPVVVACTCLLTALSCTKHCVYELEELSSLPGNLSANVWNSSHQLPFLCVLQGQSLAQQQLSPVTGAHDIAAEASEDPKASNPSTHPSSASPRRLTRSMQAEGLPSVPSPSAANSSRVTLEPADADTHPCRVTRSAQSRGTDGNAAPNSSSQAQSVREVRSERSQQAALSQSPVLQTVTRSRQEQSGISIQHPPEAAGLTPAGPSDVSTLPVSSPPSLLSLPRTTRSGKSCMSQGPVSSASQHPVSSAAASPHTQHPGVPAQSPDRQLPISQLRVSPRLAPKGVAVTPVLADGSVQEGQAGTSPRQTHSQRAVPSKAPPSSLAQGELHPSLWCCLMSCSYLKHYSLLWILVLCRLFSAAKTFSPVKS